MYWKGVVEELLWIVSGCTDANVLSAKGVHIWDANATTEFLESVGQGHRKQGDLGPVYGFQWRHFGAKYIDCKTDYTGQGVDQLANVINRIRTNPSDRRMIVSAWNPLGSSHFRFFFNTIFCYTFDFIGFYFICYCTMDPDLIEMALPPCHCMFQFYVCNGELSCQMYQRSADMVRNHWHLLIFYLIEIFDFSRHLGSWSSVQHCQLLTVDTHGGSCDRFEARRFRAHDW